MTTRNRLAVAGLLVLGALQFSAGIRRRHPSWHRGAGLVLVPAGALVAASGVWMTATCSRTWPARSTISGGRLILGIGAGWNRKDYEEFGYEFGTAGSRIAALAAAMPRIRARLAAGNPSSTRHIPILVGGGGEKKTLRAVGRDTARLVERSVEVTGPPSEVGDAITAAGATLLTLGVNGPDYDLTLAKEWVAWRDDRR